MLLKLIFRILYASYPICSYEGTRDLFEISNDCFIHTVLLNEMECFVLSLF